jgi:hypothetical protein
MDFSQIISVLAIIISIASICYTLYQNRRNMNVNLWINNKNVPMVTLCAYNSSYRSLAIINFTLCVNNEPITIIENMYTIPASEKRRGTSFSLKITKNIDLPHILGEGEAVFFLITAQQLTSLLYIKGYKNEVKLSGYFKTAQNKIYNSESTINLDIEEYRMGNYY